MNHAMVTSVCSPPVKKALFGTLSHTHTQEDNSGGHDFMTTWSQGEGKGG